MERNLGEALKAAKARSELEMWFFREQPVSDKKRRELQTCSRTAAHLELGRALVESLNDEQRESLLELQKLGGWGEHLREAAMTWQD